MKKFFILIVVLLAMISCSEQQPDTNIYHEVEKTNDIYRYEYIDFKVVIIDSCEYLIGSEYAGYHGYGYLSHKGNCKYCAERRKRELKNAK